MKTSRKWFGLVGLVLVLGIARWSGSRQTDLIVKSGTSGARSGAQGESWKRESSGKTDSRLSEMSPRSAEKLLRDAYFEISLGQKTEASVLGLATLAEGLRSSNETVRRKAAAFVENLLIRVAHRMVDVDPEYAVELRALVGVYKERAADQVKRMKEAFPQSRTLAYLREF